MNPVLRASRAVLAVLIGSCLLLASCGKKDDGPAPPAAVNTTDPHWVSQSTPHAKVAVVFVHGLTGDLVDTWKNANGKTFFQLLKDSPAGAQVDVFAFGFTSNMIRNGSFDIREAANRMQETLKFNGVLDYPAIVFVGHSMGGLVVLRHLISHRELIDKVPLVVLYATPQEGAQIALIGQRLMNNSALRELVPADGNAFLQTLNDDWRLLPKRPHVSCGYEKKALFEAVVIVPWSTATRFCDGAPAAITDADHLSIVKPDRATHDSVVLLVNALNDHAVGKNLVARLETPDFVPEGDHLVFQLSDPNGKSSARLVNSGRAKLQYTLAELSDPNLFLWPDDTPRDLLGEKTERLAMALGFGAKAKEYRFVLRSDVSPDKTVLVRVPDLEALRAKRAALVDTALNSLNTHLADPATFRRMVALPPGDPRAGEDAVRVVHAAIARESPALPPHAQWLLAADVLAGSNWPKLAAKALRHAETALPSTARNPSTQRLAASVAAQSGEAKIFDSVATSPAAASAAPPLRLNAAQLSSVSALAARLQQIPALKAYGLSLEGDVALLKGNKNAARNAFIGASQIQGNPSITTRIKSLDRAPADKALSGVPN